MKYAVLYYSETGNTEELAEQVYTAINSREKTRVNLKETWQIPYADVYFVGFPIHRNNCSMKVIEALEQIDTGKLAFFATCGLSPTDAYKQKLEEAISVWLPDDTDYLGMYLCQGRTIESEKENFYNAKPEYRDKLEEMFLEGENHPNRDDYDEVIHFVRQW